MLQTLLFAAPLYDLTQTTLHSISAIFSSGTRYSVHKYTVLTVAFAHDGYIVSRPTIDLRMVGTHNHSPNV